ncbi:MAG: DNA-3-methyladenine glycosylase [Nitrospiraceae bacterium]
MSMILPRDFFNRPTLEVAGSLVGKYLVREQDGLLTAGKIIEVEAYIGQEDKACHASKGRTARTDVLFGPPGHAYVYLCYGMYEMLNVVTEQKVFSGRNPFTGGGVLGEPDRWAGRLTRAFGIDRRLNRCDLTVGEALWFEDREERLQAGALHTYPRIGVDYAGEWAHKPWRFRLRTENSTPRRPSSKRPL